MTWYMIRFDACFLRHARIRIEYSASHTFFHNRFFAGFESMLLAFAAIFDWFWVDASSFCGDFWLNFAFDWFMIVFWVKILRLGRFPPIWFICFFLLQRFLIEFCILIDLWLFFGWRLYASGVFFRYYMLSYDMVYGMIMH